MWNSFLFESFLETLFMDATKILAADILDILFDGKNKDYGAYELRKNYQRRLGGAILMMLAILAVLIAGYYLSKSNTRVARTFIIPDDTLERFIKKCHTCARKRKQFFTQDFLY